MRIFSKFLERICIYHFQRILVLVNVVNCNFVIVCWYVRHNKVLVQSCRQHRVTTVVDVLTNNVNAARCSTEVLWLLTIQSFKTFHN